MIREIKSRRRRPSRAERLARWHRVFVVHRRFMCPRRRATVSVWFETIERRRYIGGSWDYRTL